MYKTELVTFSKLFREISSTKTKVDIVINEIKIKQFFEEHKKDIPANELSQMMGMLHAELLNRIHATPSS